jgi:hypothetical protein
MIFLSFPLYAVEKFMPTQEELIIYYRGRGVEAVGQGICGNQIKLPRSFQHRRLTVAPAHINMITCSN